MIEPNIGTPDEDEIRTHFKGLMHPEKEIEIIPHTKIWATVDGTLLWDPKNGFANLSPRPELSRVGPEFYVMPPDCAGIKNTIPAQLDKPTRTKTIIYLTGPQASGKTTLVDLMSNAVELARDSFIGFVDLTRAVAKHDTVETIVITTNSTTPKAFNIDQALRIYCRERKLQYYSINLTRNENGN